MIYGMIGRQSGWQEDGRPAEHNNDLTDDLIDLLDVKETSDFYSDDLIEDQAGGPLQDHVDQDSGDGYDDDNMLLGIDSCVKREGSVDVLEDDGSQSSDGRDFLDRLEGSNSPERIEVPHKDVGNLRRPNLLLSDEHFGQKQSSSLKKDSHDNSPEARLKPKMVKYDRVDERINEESEELSFNICLGWSELASKLRIGLVRQLKQAAYFYNLQYKDRFEVVRHTMYIEKTKFLFSKMRESRKKLLGYSLSKLKQLKDNTKHEQEKNNLHASYLFSQKQSENSKFSSERRRQMVYKIAGSITSYKRSPIVSSDKDAENCKSLQEVKMNGYKEVPSTKISITNHQKMLYPDWNQSDEVSTPKIDNCKNSFLTSPSAMNSTCIEGLLSLVNVISMCQWKSKNNAFKDMKPYRKPYRQATAPSPSLELDSIKYLHKKFNSNFINASSSKPSPNDKQRREVSKFKFSLADLNDRSVGMSTMRDCVKTPPYKNKQVSLRLTPGVFKSSQQPKNSIVLTARQKLFVSELCLKEIEKFSPKMQLRRNENSKNRNSLRNPQPQLPIDEYTLKVPKMTDRMVINSTTMSRLQHSLKKTVLSKITDSLLKKKI